MLSRTTKTTLLKAIALFAPPPDLGTLGWAEKRRRLPKGVTPKPGPYSSEEVPFQREPQESFHDPTVQVTVFQWGKRMGKTECTLNLQGRTIDLDPQSILVVYPTLESAKNWSKKFFTPMIRACHWLRRLVRTSKSRDSNNTILSKEFPGGTIACIGANSPSGFRQVQAPVIICDEIDAMEDGPEGDPIMLAFGRADNYPNSIQVLSSTPTIKGKSRIEAWYLSGDQRRWFVPCQNPACRHMQTIRWEQIDFSKHGTIESPRWVCERDECQHAHTDAERVAAVLVGEWRATSTEPFNGVRSYHLSQLYSTFPPKRGFASRLHQVVAEFKKAKADGPATLQVWTNTTLAETFEDQGAKIDHNAIWERREAYGIEPVPEGVLLVTAGVDQQADRLEVEIVGWGEDDETWGLRYHVIYGDPEQDDVWRELDQELLREYRHPVGANLKILRTFIDMGDKQSRVLDYCRPRMGRGIFACKGFGRTGATPPPLLPARPSTNNATHTPFWPVGVNAAKSMVYDRLTLLPPGPRSCHFPIDGKYDETYFEQLTAETVRLKYERGVAYRVFEKPSSGTRNEALDCRVYALAARHQLGVVAWQKVRESLKKSATAVPPVAPPPVDVEPSHVAKAIAARSKPPAKQPFVHRRSGGFARGW